MLKNGHAGQFVQMNSGKKTDEGIQGGHAVPNTPGRGRCTAWTLGPRRKSPSPLAPTRGNPPCPARAQGNAHHSNKPAQGKHTSTYSC